MDTNLAITLICDGDLRKKLGEGFERSCNSWTVDEFIELYRHRLIDNAEGILYENRNR